MTMTKSRYHQIISRLVAARQHAGLSQAQAASRLGFAGSSTISQYEKGHRRVDLETFIQLAQIYNVSEAWLLTGTERKSKAD